MSRPPRSPYEFEFQGREGDDELHRHLELSSVADAENFPGVDLRDAKTRAAGILGRIVALLAPEVEMAGIEHRCDRAPQRAVQEHVDWRVAERVGQVLSGSGCGIDVEGLDAGSHHAAYVSLTVPKGEAKRIRALLIDTVNDLKAEAARDLETP